MRYLKYLCAILLLPFISACSSVTPADYAHMKPQLDIRDYMNGRFKAHGVIFDWKGKASRHFVATIQGTWNGNEGVLDETFAYSDGTTDTRIWKLNFVDDTYFTGTAGDVVGISKGSQQGNALNMKYVLRHKQEGGDTIDVTIDDWMYLTNDGILINRSKIYKFGLPVGEVVISFTREGV